MGLCYGMNIVMFVQSMAHLFAKRNEGINGRVRNYDVCQVKKHILKRKVKRKYPLYALDNFG